jgi:hypothetical protein
MGRWTDGQYDITKLVLFAINGNLSQEDQQEDPSPDGKTIPGMT